MFDLKTFLQEHSSQAIIMGIVNVTPDSFSDGGLCGSVETASHHAQLMIRDGAHILDVGGESTRPGHTPISPQEEQERVIPVIKHLASVTSIPISIDTYKASTAQKALKAGASIVNDIWGFQKDPDMAQVIADVGAAVIIMYNRVDIDHNIDILDDMKRFFERSLNTAHQAGINHANVIIDPGIGFGKTMNQSHTVLKNLNFLKSLGLPILIGASRKSLIGQFYPKDTPPKERLFGTLGAHLYARQQGANILRVHDVKAHREACCVFDAISKDPV